MEAQAMAAALACLQAGAPFQPETQNLASGEEVANRCLAEHIMDLLGQATSASDQRHLLRVSGGGDPGVPINWRAEISGLRLLGFEPQFELADSIGDAIRRYLLWCQSV